MALVTSSSIGHARRVLDSVRGAPRYVLSAFVFLLAWHIWSRFYGIPALFPGPISTFLTFVELLSSGVLITDSFISVSRIAIGFLIGSLIGVFFGLLIGQFRIVRDILDPYINFLRFISGIAWIGIFMVWFGLGELSKIALIVYTTVFPVLINTYAGVSSISRNKNRAADCFGASHFQKFFLITLPGAIPYIITGMRLSLINSFVIIVAAEMVQADSGIGFMMMSARLYLAPDIIFCGMIALGILGLLSDRLLEYLTRVFLGPYYKHG